MRAKAKPGEWILGGHWDERRWTPAGLPSRASIDDVTNSSPVFVVRYDGRMALANATALGRAGITERTPDPPGGAIVRDDNGFPTGVLQDAAMDIVARTIPAVTSEQRQRALKHALEQAESLFSGPGERRREADVETAELYEQIGRLKMELEWLKKKAAQSG